MAKGVLHRRYRAVYSVGHDALSREGQWLAAVLASGPGAALSHLAAAKLWRVSRFRSPIDVVVARPRRAQGTIRLHVSKTLIRSDVTLVRRIPVTTVARTLVDLTDVLTSYQLAHVINEAAFRGALNLAATRDAMARANGRHHLHVLDEALALYADGSAGTRSGKEDAFLGLLSFADIAEQPRVNTSVGGEEVDFLWAGHRLVVEVDGSGHERPTARRDDAAKDRRLRAAGYTVLRFADVEIERSPDRVLATLASALRPPDG